jgi:hypothetical protein
VTYLRPDGPIDEPVHHAHECGGCEDGAEVEDLTYLCSDIIDSYLTNGVTYLWPYRPVDEPVHHAHECGGCEDGVLQGLEIRVWDSVQLQK